MKTKLANCEESSKIPAGIFLGTELFSCDGKMYAISYGVRMSFEDLPGSDKRSFIEMYIEDKEGQDFIRKHFGITGFEAGFKKWLFCKFGALDGEPDSINGRVTPDTFNSACVKTNCPGRGKFCGFLSGVKGYELETIHALKAGKTASQIADSLSLSVPAVKSRIERLKEKFQVVNVAALIATVTELGI